MFNLGKALNGIHSGIPPTNWEFSKGECSIMECAHLGYSRLKDDETREVEGCQEMSRVELSFYHSVLSFYLLLS